MDVVLASARPDLRFALEVLLREQPGVTVVGTATGSEGLLALVETTLPEAVILDWRLPGRPPAEVVAEARGIDLRPAIVVLGKDRPAQRAAMDAGVDAIVLLGDPPEYLLQALEKARLSKSVASELHGSAHESAPNGTKGE